MTILSMLDRLIFGPLLLLFDVIFKLAFRSVSRKPGVLIVFLSLAINLLVVAAVVLLVWLVLKKRPALIRIVSLAGCVAVTGMSVVDAAGIERSNRELLASLDVESIEQQAVFPLDKTGRNVIVMMLDRGLGCLLPYILQEKPELMERFDGFTFYPNTLSYGSGTFVGTPGLFGGYEYTPLEMNRRTDERLLDKHNQALNVMPTLFTELGYDVTICDPPYAGYSEVTNLFLMIDNETTHSATLLQEPAYEPAQSVNNVEYDREHPTRTGLDGLFDLRLNSSEDMLSYNPLLMVKDFDSRGFAIDDTFMTNADTPLLALDGLMENIVNPFTGKPLTDAQKHEPEQFVVNTKNFQPEKNLGTQYTQLRWYANANNVLDLSAWRKIEGELE